MPARHLANTGRSDPTPAGSIASGRWGLAPTHGPLCRYAVDGTAPSPSDADLVRQQRQLHGVAATVVADTAAGTYREPALAR